MFVLETTVTEFKKPPLGTGQPGILASLPIAEGHAFQLCRSEDKMPGSPTCSSGRTMTLTIRCSHTISERKRLTISIEP